jgi:TetR/AcrR family transcriptional repressor of mexJK operon
MESGGTGSSVGAAQAKDRAENPRRHAILDAAKQVFYEQGYAGASMDRIAEHAGVTKRTVYAHFPSKHDLFAAVVARGCANVIDQLPRAESLPPDPREGLLRALTRARELMASPGCIRLERMVAAEAERHPEFAATLSEAFAAGEAMFAAALDAWVSAGRLKPHDTALAARMLNDLVGGGASFRGLLGQPPLAPEGLAAAEAACTLYLAAYGV